MSWRSILLLLLLGFAVGVMFFLLAKGGVIGLPTSPLGEVKPRVSLLDEVPQAERRIARQLVPVGARRRVSLRLHEEDLRDLALAGLSRHPEGRRVLELAQQIRADIDGGEVGIELVVDFATMPRERLNEKELETVRKIEKLLPVIGQSSLPIAVYGSPVASAGRIRLAGTPWMRVSVLKLSLATVSERLGVSRDELEESLEIEWPGYEILEVTVRDGVVELVVARA